MQGITIVTPSLNQATYLEQCIDSILSQNYPDLEYIIMDGGSTDGSVEIIKKYEQHLAYWQSAPDGGHYQALNAGFKRSTKPLMGWLNADDMLHRGGLTIVGEVFSELPEVEFLTGKRVGFDGNGDIVSYGHIDQRWSHDLLLEKELVRKETLFIMQEATFWRRSLWQRCGGCLDTSYSLAADFELWLRMSRHASLHTVNALTGGFRCYSMEQRCNKNRDDYVEQCCRVIDHELSLDLPPAPHRSTAPPLIEYPLRQTGSPGSLQLLVRRELPKISIVTPSFNQAPYLEECLDSVLSQNYPNLEYIVMDGGSSDGSAEIIGRYGKHLNYWHSRRDYGQYHAVNTGFAMSTGEVMAWLNSDDKYHPGALWLVADTFRALAEVRWLTGSPTLWDKEGKVCGFSSVPPSYSQQKYLNGEIHSPYIQQESTFWRRSLWDEAGGSLSPDFPLAADMELWARFFRFAQLHTLHAPLGGFRSHPGEGQRSEQGRESYQQEAERIVARERELYRRHPGAPLRRPPLPLQVADVVARAGSRITADVFGAFNYSRTSHFPYFAHADLELYGRAVAPTSCSVAEYQELLVYSFIRDSLPQGSRILVVEGGAHLTEALGAGHDLWSLCRGRDGAQGGRRVTGALGELTDALPQGYFDLVAAFHRLPGEPENEALCREVCRDLARVLKPSAPALHCFDLQAQGEIFQTSLLLDYLFERMPTCHRFVPFAQAPGDPFVFFRDQPPLSPGEQPVHRLSYNVLWHPGAAGLAARQECGATTPPGGMRMALNLAGPKAAR